MASSVLNTAEKLLQEKFANPYGALVGGYYLLGAGDLRRLHSWPNNFAEGFEWLPDSAIIHAWQILLDSDIQDKSIARTRLLEATQRGLPIFKQGLRYLMDGLRNFSNQARKELHKDHDVEKAFSYWQKIARAVNWNQRFVTFYGRSPYNPSFKPVTGIPKDTSEKERLLPMTLPISFKKS
jgi:hypothetical protein